MNNKTKTSVDVGTFHLFVLTSHWQWCEWNVFSIYLVTKPISPSIVHGCIEWCTLLTALPVLLRLFPCSCRYWCCYLSRHHYFFSRVRKSPTHHVTSVLLCSMRCQGRSSPLCLLRCYWTKSSSTCLMSKLYWYIAIFIVLVRLYSLLSFP